MVIIGLLIGGIFVGQSLIHNAQLNAVITEFTRYDAGVRAFREQYQAIPGDITNATQFWGIAAGNSGTDVTCGNATESTVATCNGNGDGYLEWPAQGGGSGNVYEPLLFWKHLANAKMIEGSYNGTGPAIIIGTNVPASRYGGNVGWSVYIKDWLLPAGGGAIFFNTDTGSANDIYNLGGLLGGSTDGPGLTPKDAWSIDKKIDDGKPALGNVMASWNNNCTTASDKNSLTAAYALNNSAIACTMIFLSDF